MTDNASTNTQQQAVQKDNSSPAPGQGRPGGGRGGKRQHVPRPGSAQSGSTKGDNQRPSSRTSKKGDAGGPKAESKAIGDTEAKAPRPELAFGQARVRDLIRKDQNAGQA